MSSLIFESKQLHNHLISDKLRGSGRETAMRKEGRYHGPVKGFEVPTSAYSPRCQTQQARGGHRRGYVTQLNAAESIEIENFSGSGNQMHVLSDRRGLGATNPASMNFDKAR